MSELSVPCVWKQVIFILSVSQQSETSVYFGDQCVIKNRFMLKWMFLEPLCVISLLRCRCLSISEVMSQEEAMEAKLDHRYQR